MNILKELFYAYWKQDFEILLNPDLIWIIYFLVFIIIFLENGLLPAAFLPGDSLLVLFGVLIAKGNLNFLFSLFILTVSASLGSWISYLQGNWLSNNRWIQSWMTHFPDYYHQRAYRMFHRHGLFALLIGRFIAFVRTLLPTIAGISGLNSFRFHLYNWISAFLWILILILFGFLVARSSLFKNHEAELMLCLMLMPIALLTFGLTMILSVILKKKYFHKFKRRK